MSCLIEVCVEFDVSLTRLLMIPYLLLKTYTVTFYKRNYARKNEEFVPPVSEKLAARLQQVINAELLAILSIPFLATLMARGVWFCGHNYACKK